MARGKGKIDLSTVVSTLKNYVDIDGKFAEKNIKDLNMQAQILINYFSAIKYHWDKEDKWLNSNQNVFFKASGFIAALEFFFEHIYPECVETKKFTTKYIISLLDFSKVGLILNSDIKGSDGKTSRKRIVDTLKSGLTIKAPKEDEYEF